MICGEGPKKQRRRTAALRLDLEKAAGLVRPFFLAPVRFFGRFTHEASAGALPGARSPKSGDSIA